MRDDGPSNVDMNRQKGFTLIELLVVIAIIGLLAAIVLASLNTARAKGADAAVKANLANTRAQAEILYDTVGCYAFSGTGCTAAVPAVYTLGACPTAAQQAAGAAGSSIFHDATIWGQIEAARKAGAGFSSCSASVGGTAWAAAALQKTTGKAWCVDSTGISKEAVPSAQTQAGLDAVIAVNKCV
jgi:type IV pilus assembly protein PilA